MAKYANSYHIQSAEAIVQIIKSVQVLLSDANVPLELRLFHDGDPLDIKEMPPHSANTQSAAIAQIAAEIERGASFVASTDPGIVQCSMENWARQLRTL